MVLDSGTSTGSVWHIALRFSRNDAKNDPPFFCLDTKERKKSRLFKINKKL